MTDQYDDWAFRSGVWTKLSAWKCPDEWENYSDWCLDELEKTHFLYENDSEEGPLWVIDVLRNGAFSVSRSHRVLTDCETEFPSFAEAVVYCEKIDDDLMYGRHHSPQSRANIEQATAMAPLGIQKAEQPKPAPKPPERRRLRPRVLFD